MKNKIKILIGSKLYSQLTKAIMHKVNDRDLRKNFNYDLKVYKKYSRVFHSKSHENID